MEIKEWIVKNKNWFIYPIGILFFYWVSSVVNPKETKNNVTSPSNEVKIQTPIETPVETITLSQEEIEKNRVNEEKVEKKRKYEIEKERITGCLVGSVDGSWGTYNFSSNGVFSWEVNTGPYQQYREGTWKYIGGNKVKLNKKWIPRSGTITISKYCEIFGLNF